MTCAGRWSADELEVHYQPQIDLATGAMIGAEALMRWTRPGHGAVPPNVFIPISEETGLIVSMGAWLLGEACREAATWPAAMRVAVNVSPLQFRLAGFLDTVRGALAQSGLDPHRLELEVTEGILIHDTEETLAVLAELRAIGVRLAMDDFGTGYASLGYLQEIPLRQDQDRPVVRAESRQRPERRGDRARGGRAERRAGHLHQRRGGGEQRAGGDAARAWLPRGAGLPVLKGGAEGHAARAARPASARRPDAATDNITGFFAMTPLPFTRQNAGRAFKPGQANS